MIKLILHTSATKVQNSRLEISFRLLPYWRQNNAQVMRGGSWSSCT